jgi:hypothetical protein
MRLGTCGARQSASALCAMRSAVRVGQNRYRIDLPGSIAGGRAIDPGSSPPYRRSSIASLANVIPVGSTRAGISPKRTVATTMLMKQRPVFFRASSQHASLGSYKHETRRGRRGDRHLSQQARRRGRERSPCRGSSGGQRRSASRRAASSRARSGAQRWVRQLRGERCGPAGVSPKASRH